MERNPGPMLISAVLSVPGLQSPAHGTDPRNLDMGLYFPFPGESLRLSCRTPLNDTSTSQCQGWNEARGTNQSQLRVMTGMPAPSRKQPQMLPAMLRVYGETVGLARERGKVSSEYLEVEAGCSQRGAGNPSLAEAPGVPP